MRKLLIATTNPAKLAEISSILAPFGVPLVCLKDIPPVQPPEETGETFTENALIKARYYARHAGLPTITDDGGFEIDALGGKPGVHSHRWVHGDREATDEELVAHTMKCMEGIAEGKRTARLTVVLAYVTPEGDEYTETASITGTIPLKPSPILTPGFPYRSLLFLPSIGKFYDTSLLSPQEHDRINHRKQALAALMPHLLSSLGVSLEKGAPSTYPKS